MRAVQLPWRTLVHIIATGFLVCAVVFINGYPLVYSDTGAYLASSFSLEPLPDRPLGYGLFIRMVTWQSTLWTVVVAQGTLTSWLLLELILQFFPRDRALRWHVITIAVLLIVSSMPWFSAEVMPDIFTPLLLIVWFLLWYGNEIPLYRRTMLWVFAVVFLGSHYSHVAMTLAALGLLVLVRARSGSGSLVVPWSVLSGTLVACLGVITMQSAMNASYGYGWKYAPSRHTFFAARLCDSDVLGRYLDERCSEKPNWLCRYRAELPTQPVAFLWAGDSPLAKEGLNMASADPLLEPIVRDLMTSPVHLGHYIKSACIGSVVQLFQVRTNSGLQSYSEGSSPYFWIQKKLPDELGPFRTSVQSLYGYTLFDLDVLVLLALLASCVFMFLKWSVVQAHPALERFIALVVVWYVLNAIITASLANVYDRLQSRVAWLLVLCAILVVSKAIPGRQPAS